MKRSVIALLIAAATPAGATTFSTAQLSSANDGLQAMRELNAIVLGNLNSGALVEGKTFVGGSMSGSAEQFGTGNTTVGNGFTQSTSRSILTVGGTVSTDVKLGNGSNGGSGKLATTAAQNRIQIGGSLVGTITPGSISTTAPLSVQTGGSFNAQNYNANPYATATFGSSASNVRAQDMPYLRQDATLKAGGSNDLAAAIAGQTSTLRTNLTTLSDVLRNLNTNATLNLSDRNNIHFDYSTEASTADFVVANVNAADLFGSSGTLLLSLLTSGTGYKTTVINVIGTGAFSNSLINNDTQNSNDRNVIWNFNNTLASNSSFATTTAFHGSILAPNASVSNSDFIEGSLVSNMFSQGGEVHLGTFNGTSQIVTNPTTAVPEPAGWATMLVGFGVVGSAMRRRHSREPSNIIA